jgi:hypothetical protein
MAAFSKVLLSDSTQGRGIKVVATSTAGTAIHSTGTSSSIQDELWLYAFNSHTADVLLTVEFGNATAPDSNITITIKFDEGLFLVVPGLILTGSGSAAATVKAFAATANVVTITGYVNRIT